MESRFENQYYLTRKNLISQQRAVQRWNRLLAGVYGVLEAAFALGAAGCLAAWLSTGDEVFRVYGINAAAGFVLFGAVFCISPIQAARRLERGYKSVSGGRDTEVHVSFDDTGIQICVRPAGKEQRFLYQEVTKVRRTKEYYGLCLGKSGWVMVDRNGFLKGDEREFERFLRRRCGGTPRGRADGGTRSGKD